MWVPAPPLWLLRPKDGKTPANQHPVRADDPQDAFRGDEGMETLLVRGKARPVVVLSPSRALRASGTVLVAPLYSYRDEGTLAKRREEIEAGKIPSCFHIEGPEELRLQPGALRLDQIQPVDKGYLTLQRATMTDIAFGRLISHTAMYIQILDRRPA